MQAYNNGGVRTCTLRPLPEPGRCKSQLFAAIQCSVQIVFECHFGTSNQGLVEDCTQDITLLILDEHNKAKQKQYINVCLVPITNYRRYWHCFKPSFLAAEVLRCLLPTAGWENIVFKELHIKCRVLYFNMDPYTFLHGCYCSMAGSDARLARLA